jgi:hypothetical protein
LDQHAFTPIHSILSLKVDGNIRSFEILILHHEFERGAKKTPLKLVYVMAELVVMLGELGDVGVVDAELGFSHQNVTVPEVDEQVSIVCLEPILHSQHFELLSVLGHFSRLHLSK